ncbi:MAG: VOC family protein, partial [Pseudomonadota bacterium]|nr:VOC family protein [Pseudomonadota bacterium]
MMSIFHLAYHVDDLDKARAFYGDLLGCTEGRSTETWVDFNFFGHQISLHLGPVFATANTGKVGAPPDPPRPQTRLRGIKVRGRGPAFAAVCMAL